MAKRGRPTYDELVEALRDVIEWGHSMGGWEAKVWQNLKRLSSRIADANSKPKPKVRTWTVLALYPDFSTDDFGGDIYMDTVRAETATQAEAMAQRKAHRSNKTIPAEDFKVICVLLGDHWDVQGLPNDIIDNLYRGVKP